MVGGRFTMAPVQRYGLWAWLLCIATAVVVAACSSDGADKALIEEPNPSEDAGVTDSSTLPDNPDVTIIFPPEEDAGSDVIEIPPVCGDGVVNQVGEQCDDRNREPNDGCSVACKIEPFHICPPEGGACVPEMVCGDLAITGIEECDDGNVAGGDGCSPNCRIEASYFDCPNNNGIGGTCQSTVACGDGRVEAGEVCDDLNQVGGDGCAADCLSVEVGYICRKSGTPCTPQCGDGQIIAGLEECDDANKESGDGCSGACRIEPGALCEGVPSVCVATQCGDGVVEGTEICDNGTENGLFYGDGSGCSLACTREPTCRPEGGGATRACDSFCGDGMRLGAEQCDDGNLVPGDGCSPDCLFEDGFVCDTAIQTDAQECSSGTGDCLVLPIILRDFKSQDETGGHPDFFFMGAQGIGGRTICVPNAACDAGDVDCPDPASDTTEKCLGLVEDDLNDAGKPVFNASRVGGNECDCIFTDWDDTGVLGTAATDTNNDGKAVFVGSVPVIESAGSFAQWYTDVPGVNETVRTVLELERSGVNFQFSSSDGRTILDDIHDEVPLESGFFPLEDQPAAKLCNMWPYWGTWAGCAGDQWDPIGEEFLHADGVERNFYFTTEARYLMVYQGGEYLDFFGDDDVWVFINGKLALDLGGTHQQLQGSVTLEEDGDARFGLEPGNVYEIVVFHADRHPRDSNYQLTLSGFETDRSVCNPHCGNGVATLTEECDLGEGNDDAAYGGCRTDCTWGPFCGDGEINGPEVCDDGANATLEYGAPGCAPGCVLPPSCGNGVIELAEQCDDGAANDDAAPGGCSTTCRFNPFCGDGVVVEESGEACDLGAANEPPEAVSYGGCTTECRLGPLCGDGTVDEPWEECDDGNLEAYDGCSPLCLKYELPE